MAKTKAPVATAEEREAKRTRDAVHTFEQVHAAIRTHGYAEVTRKQYETVKRTNVAYLPGQLRIANTRTATHEPRRVMVDDRMSDQQCGLMLLLHTVTSSMDDEGIPMIREGQSKDARFLYGVETDGKLAEKARRGIFELIEKCECHAGISPDWRFIFQHSMFVNETSLSEEFASNSEE